MDYGSVCLTDTLSSTFDRHERAGGEGRLSFISRLNYAMDAIQA